MLYGLLLDADREGGIPSLQRFLHAQDTKWERDDVNKNSLADMREGVGVKFAPGDATN